MYMCIFTYMYICVNVYYVRACACACACVCLCVCVCEETYSSSLICIHFLLFSLIIRISES